MNEQKKKGADASSGTKRPAAAAKDEREEPNGSAGSAAADNANKKLKSSDDEVVEALPVIPGFDLEMDTSRTTLSPATVGTVDFKEHDVLSGRGGGTNVHPGNRDFRDLINKYRTIYLKAKKNDKPAISRAIVKAVRSKGGQFLKKNEKDNLYYEIGDAQAREKTSQALRQRAPEMRKLMFEQEQLAGGGGAAAGAPSSLPPGMLPPHLQPMGSGPTAESLQASRAAAGLSDEQLRMAMPLLAANGIPPNFAAGLQAGMQFHHPHLASIGGYSPAFYQAMMSGMGLGSSVAGAAGGMAGMGAPAAPTGTAQDAHIGKEVVTKSEESKGR